MVFQKSTLKAFFALVILAAILLAFLPLPSISSVSPLPSISPAADQVEFLRHLELGRQYERRGLLSQAQSEYQQAALAEDEVIAQAGRENDQRLAEFQRNPLYQIQSKLTWLKDPVFWVSLLVLAALLIIWYSPRPAAYQVLPMLDGTKDQVGKPIHLLVRRKLKEITETYQKAQERLLLDLTRFDVPQADRQPDPYADLLTVLSNIQFGPISLPLEKLIPFLEKWRARNETQLGGDFYQVGEASYLDACVTRREKVLENWPLVARGQDLGGVIETLSSELTYRFLKYALNGKAEFQSWVTLKAWSEGLVVAQQPLLEPARFQAALTELAAAHLQEPHNRQIAFLMGTMHSRIEQYEEARDAFSRVMQGTDDDLSLVAALRSAETRYLEFKPHESEEVRSRFDRLYRSLDIATLNPRQKQVAALALCGQAMVWAHWLHKDARNQNKFDHVTENCQRALGLASGSTEVQAACSMALGTASFNRGCLDEALQAFDNVLEIRRTYPAALIYKARVLAERIYSMQNKASGLDEQAIEAFEASDLERKDQLMQEINTNAAEAIALLRESIDQNLPGRTFAEKELVQLYCALGRVHAKTGSLDVGQRHYEQAVALDPFDADAWDNLAYRPLDAGRTDPKTLTKCEPVARKAVALGSGGPQEASYRATLADVLYYQERYREAMEEIERACALIEPKAENKPRIMKIKNKIQAKLDEK